MASIFVNLFKLGIFLLYATLVAAVVRSFEKRVSSKLSYDNDIAGLRRVINVLDYGAVGDGQHDDTKAFGQAWDEACVKSSTTLLVPRNNKFLVNNLVFGGECESGLIFQVDGNIIAFEDPELWENKNVWLQFDHLDQFTLRGSGTIDGHGNKWWSNFFENKIGQKDSDDRPTVIHLNACNGVVIEGLRIRNSPRFHLTMSGCENVSLIRVEISAPEESPNTDGIDISTSTNIIVKDSLIGTGDDCIAIGNAASHIVIKNIICGPGHGISIGSLGKDHTEAHVHSVHVDGAKLKATKNGVRIKTWPGGSGMASDIVFENVEMINAENSIIIDQYYFCSSDSCRKESSAVQIKNVIYKSISGTSATEVAINMKCSLNSSCTDITFSNVTLALTSGGKVKSDCQNARGQSTGTIMPSGCLASM